MSQLQKRYMSPGSHIQYHERHDSTLKKISCRELERWPYATAHGTEYANLIILKEVIYDYC